MIKVPATPAGLPAIEELLFSGLNINITLIFAVDVYEQVAEAYVQGLERRVAAGLPVDRIASVASFFVSRIDGMVDKQLGHLADQAADDRQKQRIKALMGKAAIANAKLAYESFKHIFGGDRFAKLKQKGARVQRPLWASTSTKNPNYPDTMYLDSLIGTDTVNTVPPATLDAFRDHGAAKSTLDAGIEEAHHTFDELKAVGIDMKAVTDKLTEEGVASFSESFDELFEVIEARRVEVMRSILARHSATLGRLSGRLRSDLEGSGQAEGGLPPLEERSYSVEGRPRARRDHPQLIGLAQAGGDHAAHVANLLAFAEEIRKAGFEYAVVLGMGGSSLFPEVLGRTFGKIDGYPQLHVLDSVVPTAVRHLEQKINVGKTLFIVSSKSGDTTEPRMFERYFHDRVKRVKGEMAGDNFIAITDPGTQLAKDAAHHRFRRIFLNMPDIGGGYSALSYFGMVPFAVMGGDLKTLLEHALHAEHACAGPVGVKENPGARLGTMLASLAKLGRNKLTLVTAPPFDSLGLWIEQLIAESYRQGRQRHRACHWRAAGFPRRVFRRPGVRFHSCEVGYKPEILTPSWRRSRVRAIPCCAMSCMMPWTWVRKSSCGNLPPRLRGRCSLSTLSISPTYRNRRTTQSVCLPTTYKPAHWRSRS